MPTQPLSECDTKLSKYDIELLEGIEKRDLKKTISALEGGANFNAVFHGEKLDKKRFYNSESIFERAIKLYDRECSYDKEYSFFMKILIYLKKTKKNMNLD